MAQNLIICDTDVMIDYWNKTSIRHIETQRILESEIGLDQVIVTAITRLELLMGAGNKAEESLIKKKLQRFSTVLINDTICAEAMYLFEQYRLSHGLAIPDCFIAATAKVMQLELFTYNIKDYRFIGKLKLFSI